MEEVLHAVSGTTLPRRSVAASDASVQTHLNGRTVNATVHAGCSTMPSSTSLYYSVLHFAAMLCTRQIRPMIAPERCRK